jgi:hypothetical protein
VDFEALTPAQQQAASLVAINRDFDANPRVLARLVELGVIESHDENLGGHPPLVVKRYTMPVRIHMEWCAWCSKTEGATES